jgi:hypothetical protein
VCRDERGTAACKETWEERVVDAILYLSAVPQARVLRANKQHHELRNEKIMLPIWPPSHTP